MAPELHLRWVLSVGAFVLGVLVFGTALATSPPPAAESEAPGAQALGAYVDGLVREAGTRELHDDPYWHTLLHYKRGLFGLRSLVDDPAFFASPDGKHHPDRELAATLRAFFTPPDTSQAKHPVCRFPARLAWLSEQLDIDGSRLPVPVCESFESFYEGISPRSASMIFPTSHMNSPASMYGHTLLTIQGANGSELLSYAVNYSAITHETFGPFYIVRGLLGLYPGYFSILPYYAKLQQYSDVNDRDIWEYPLDLDEKEIRRLLAHVYELENIYSNYYFFSENCSYDLLFLLDAARPGLDLTDQFGWWVIPLDTVRKAKQNGLISDVVYRPSKSTKIEHLAAALSEEHRRTAVKIARGREDISALRRPEMTHEDRVRTVELTTEYLQYLYAKGKIARTDYVPRFLQTLEVRSELGAAEEWRYDIPAPGRPDHGHRSSRVVVGGGVRDEIAFQELALRPAYHDLLDGELGFKEGSEIVFGEAAVRYYPEAEELQLERIDVIHITSIAPRTEFFEHTSWKVETGFLRRTRGNGQRDLVYGLNTGFGRAYRSFLGLPYGLIETDLQVGGALEHSYSLGAGASIGLVQNVASWWKVQLQARAIFYRLGEEDDRIQLTIGQGFRLTTNWNLALEAERNTEHDVSIWDAKLGLRFFF